jgi:molecular chaperone DnaK
MRLSKLPTTRLAVSCGGQHDNIEISRDEFEAMTEDLLAQTETTLRLTIEEAGLSLDQVDECLLVGGSTRMRSVRRMITNLIGHEPKQVLNPDECVALGAAIHAVMMQLRLIEEGTSVPKPLIHENQLDRFRQMQERLINAHTMGLLALDSEGSKVVVPIIPRHAHIPRREVKTFRTSKPGQTQIRIIVMEGESPNPEACAQLGTCLVQGLPDNLPLGTPIEVSFECSHDGRLGVTARLPTIQQTVQTEINRTMGLTDDEILASRARLDALRIE